MIFLPLLKGRWGGIWQANKDYSFLATTNQQTNVKLITKFDDWQYSDNGIEQRMPWISGARLTTSKSAVRHWWWLSNRSGLRSLSCCSDVSSSNNSCNNNSNNNDNDNDNDSDNDNDNDNDSDSDSDNDSDNDNDSDSDSDNDNDNDNDGDNDSDSDNDNDKHQHQQHYKKSAGINRWSAV